MPSPNVMQWSTRVIAMAIAIAPGCSNRTVAPEIPPSVVAEVFFNAVTYGDSARAVGLIDTSTVARFQRGLQVQARILIESGVAPEMALMPCVLTRSEFQQLPAREVLARYLYSRRAGEHIGYLTGQGCVATYQRPVFDREILRSHIGSDSIARVQFRTRHMGRTVTPDTTPDTMTLIKRANGWKILYTEVDGYGPGFVAAILNSAAG